MKNYAIFSYGLKKIPHLSVFLGASIFFRPYFNIESKFDALVCWGRKPSSKRTVLIAQRANLSCIFIEDGFLRSFGAGDESPPLSLVFDEVGIYYDSTQPSAIENLLNSSSDLLYEIVDQVNKARHLIVDNQLSKYNKSTNNFLLPENNQYLKKILVVDQTFGDMSVVLGGADNKTFIDMVAAAKQEHPDAVIYIKTHPEVSSGRKKGYLTHIKSDHRTVMLRDDINPIALLSSVDHVYVVSSTMGFEALLVGKPVTCFGLPWYAGWGVTDDRIQCSRRKRQRSVDELFAAAYFHYARYLNPETAQLGNIFDVIEWLIRQKKMSSLYQGKMYGVGFRRWKAANLKPMLTLYRRSVSFVSLKKLSKERITENDAVFYWGGVAPAGLQDVSGINQAKMLRLEDGFVRSVGLGSDLIKPHSLVLDPVGIYFDARAASALEIMLSEANFTEDELRRSRNVRDYALKNNLTKYNVDALNEVGWSCELRKKIFVPGQVDDDASIQFGCFSIRSNLALLEAVRKNRPDAYIVYKPHPDVLARNRSGTLNRQQIMKWADYIETDCSVLSCIEACDEVHTMTSLTGFDALLRGKHVETYGQPFYAGWGLTVDHDDQGPAFKRRTRRLSIDELVAGCLLRYPMYWDWKLSGYTTCEAVLRELACERDRLNATGGLVRLRVGFWRRQLRKLIILVKAYAK